MILLDALHVFEVELRDAPFVPARWRPLPRGTAPARRRRDAAARALAPKLEAHRARAAVPRKRGELLAPDLRRVLLAVAEHALGHVVLVDVLRAAHHRDVLLLHDAERAVLVRARLRDDVLREAVLAGEAHGLDAGDWHVARGGGLERAQHRMLRSLVLLVAPPVQPLLHTFVEVRRVRAAIDARDADELRRLEHAQMASHGDE
mmetsp:Transcript_8883/g.29222  ORF Transcript_8883/g.29222 Transcript_8883/m.29222 type:complete len:204 (-) Transcript_8883:791-1402(-)